MIVIVEVAQAVLKDASALENGIARLLRQYSSYISQMYDLRIHANAVRNLITTSVCFDDDLRGGGLATTSGVDIEDAAVSTIWAASLLEEWRDCLRGSSHWWKSIRERNSLQGSRRFGMCYLTEQRRHWVCL